MRSMAQTKRPHHHAVELHEKRCRRPTRAVISGFASTATKLDRTERIGAANILQESIGGRTAVRKGGMALEPALAFFGEDTDSEVQPAGEAVTVERIFLLAACLDVPGVGDEGQNRAHQSGSE